MHITALFIYFTLFLSISVVFEFFWTFFKKFLGDLLMLNFFINKAQDNINSALHPSQLHTFSEFSIMYFFFGQHSFFVNNIL